MRVILSVTVAVAVGLPLACSAQQPPPPAPSLRSESIPGGVLHYAGKGLLADPAEDVSLSVANHSLRAYWLTSPGQVPGTPGPPTIYADGQPLIVTESDLPRIEAVLTGGGHTYVRVAEGVDEDDPPYLWIVDVSAPKVTVTRRIIGCIPLQQVVTDGAYILKCKVHRENRTVTHSYKDGVLR